MHAALWKLQFDTGVEGSWGGGKDKWMARLAAARSQWIAPETEGDFLKRISIQKLGLDAALCERLQRYGIVSVGSLFRTPRVFLQSHLQLTAKELQPLFYRDASPVRALFPPSPLSAEASLLWADDEDMARAIRDVSEHAEHQLHECHQQSGQLRLLFSMRGGPLTFVVKLAKPVQRADILESILWRMITDEKLREIRRITLMLERLSPAPQLQGDLWQDPYRDNRAQERIETARQTLDRKYGHQTVQSGRDLAMQMPPRFAQLIYARRGIYLP